MGRSKHLPLLLLLSILLPTPVFAQWLPDGNPVCTDENPQRNQMMVSDGVRNSIIVWEDRRNGVDYDIYAQRLDPNGNPLWTVDGIPLTTMEYDQALEAVIEDGASGVFVVWNHRPNWTSGNIYVQHVDLSGNILWTTAVQTGLEADQALDWDPGIVPDGAGGVIVIWRWDNLNGDGEEYDRIKAQRIDATGARLWGDYTNGIAIDSNTESEVSLSVCSDGAGGAFIAWQQTLPYDPDGIFVQRLGNSGSPQWGAAGIMLSDDTYYNSEPKILLSGAGGACITWSAQPSTGGTGRAQRMDASGNVLWQAYGIQLNASNPDCLIESNQGFIAVWSDNYDIHAQRVSLSGNLMWTASGITICGAPGYQRYPAVTTDGWNGAVIAWEDSRSGNNDIYMQGVDVDGNTFWPIDGIPVCTAAGNQESPDIDYAGPNDGWIVSWDDARNGSWDVYARRIFDGLCGVEPVAIDFGAIEVGSSKDTAFTLTNTGEATLSGSVTESCDHYSIVGGGGPYSLSNGQSLVVTVRFEPTAHGPHLCTIETGDAFCYDVSCSGIGAACPSGSVYYVDAGATGTADGNSWTDAFTEVRDGLAASKACAGVTEIWVAEGTYTPTGGTDREATFELRSGLALYGGFSGTETLLTDRDWFEHPTILSGDIGVAGDSLDNSYNVVTADDTDSTAVLDGFTVTGGMADGGAPDNFHGAGIVMYSGSPTLSNLIISENIAESEGGGMYCESSSPIITDVAVLNNSADNSGGGIYSHIGNPVLTNVAVVGNSSYFGGSGIMFWYGTGITLTNVTITGNTASYSDPTGVGLYIVRCSPIIENTIVWGNGPVDLTSYNASAPVISYSLIGGCGGSGAGWDSSLGIDGGYNLDEDPQFKTVYTSDPPWEVWSSSPAINAGDNTAVPAGVATDISGNPRIYGGTVDMGAYEHQGVVTDAGDVPGVPDAYALHQNVPNPFNPVTTIAFDLPKAGRVRLDVYNVKGEHVASLIDGRMTAGRKEIGWEARDGSGNPLSSGVYFYRLVAGEFVQTRKMVLLR